MIGFYEAAPPWLIMRLRPTTTGLGRVERKVELKEGQIKEIAMIRISKGVRQRELEQDMGWAVNFCTRLEKGRLKQITRKKWQQVLNFYGDIVRKYVNPIVRD